MTEGIICLCVLFTFRLGCCAVSQQQLSIRIQHLFLHPLSLCTLNSIFASLRKQCWSNVRARLNFGFRRNCSALSRRHSSPILPDIIIRTTDDHRVAAGSVVLAAVHVLSQHRFVVMNTPQCPSNRSIGTFCPNSLISQSGFLPGAAGGSTRATGRRSVLHVPVRAWSWWRGILRTLCS